MESHFLMYLVVFILAIFLGFELISRVPPTLHTPLMSGCNAISGITIVGAILASGAEQTALFSIGSQEISAAALLGFFALIFASINVVGGFLVTDRMHGMFKSKKKHD